MLCIGNTPTMKKKKEGENRIIMFDVLINNYKQKVNDQILALAQ